MPQKSEVIDGLTIMYHADGTTRASKGKMIGDQPDGLWMWYRLDGTLKRTGNFENGKTVGKWITYDKQGNPYKVTHKKK